MAVPLIILLLIIYGYTLIIFLFFLEIEHDPEPAAEPKAFHRGVSVVVPFRDEEGQLPGLLEDLSNQSYPGKLMEIILVDDHSRDGSASEVESRIEQHKNFRCLALPEGLRGKKKALAYGIREAGYERIIQVDADCRLDPGFIQAHMACLEESPSDLVAAFVSTREEGGGFLEVFDRLDVLSLIGSGAGSFGLGRPMMCSGANLSYSRELFRETRAFDPEDRIASGDDMFLMIGARKLGRRISFLSRKESVVRTAPQRKLEAMLDQRIRWASKAGSLKMADIQMMAVLVVLANSSIFLMPLWIILFSAWWPWLAGAWFVKTLADFLLLFRMTGICGSRRDLLFFLPVSLLYYPYFMTVLLGSLVRRPDWKGTSR